MEKLYFEFIFGLIRLLNGQTNHKNKSTILVLENDGQPTVCFPNGIMKTVGIYRSGVIHEDVEYIDLFQPNNIIYELLSDLLHLELMYIFAELNPEESSTLLHPDIRVLTDSFDKEPSSTSKTWFLLKFVLGVTDHGDFTNKYIEYYECKTSLRAERQFLMLKTILDVTTQLDGSILKSRYTSRFIDKHLKNIERYSVISKQLMQTRNQN